MQNLLSGAAPRTAELARDGATGAIRKENRLSKVSMIYDDDDDE